MKSLKSQLTCFHLACQDLPDALLHCEEKQSEYLSIFGILVPISFFQQRFGSLRSHLTWTITWLLFLWSIALLIPLLGMGSSVPKTRHIMYVIAGSMHALAVSACTIISIPLPPGASLGSVMKVRTKSSGFSQYKRSNQIALNFFFTEALVLYITYEHSLCPLLEISMCHLASCPNEQC